MAHSRAGESWRTVKKGGRHWVPCRRGKRDQEGHREHAQAGDAQLVSAMRRVTGSALKRETRELRTQSGRAQRVHMAGSG